MLRRVIDQAYRTERWYRHQARPEMLYTDGIKDFADCADAWWLIDLIAAEVFGPLKTEDFIEVKILVASDKSTRIVADSREGKTLWSRSIEASDLPKGLWVLNLSDNVLYLPTEY